MKKYSVEIYIITNLIKSWNFNIVKRVNANYNIKSYNPKIR